MSVNQFTATIQLGMVSVPVKGKAAVVTDGVSFTMMHANCGGAMGYTQAWYCKAGDNCTAIHKDKKGNVTSVDPISRSDSVRAWNGYAVDDDYIQSLKGTKQEVIPLLKVVDAAEIDPRHYERSYDLTPVEGHEKVYKLFAEALERSGKVAYGTAVFQTTVQPIVVRPRDGILALETMFWPADLTRGGRDEAARMAVSQVTVSEAEASMADMLVNALTGHFDSADLVDPYLPKVREYLAKVETGEVPEVMPVAAKVEPTVDIMAALQASIDAANATGKPKKAVKVA